MIKALSTLTAAMMIAVLAGTPSALAQASNAPKRAPKLTCTFISKQCVTECSKQVAVEFCRDYCGRTRQSCLMTGRWEGPVGQQFTHVQRR